MRAFWELPIEDLDPKEWESLCDRCGKCCFIFDVLAHARTSVPCRLLDTETMRCTNYRRRFHEIQGPTDGYRCKKVTLPYLEYFSELPETCAYVRRHKGERLEDWQVDRARESYREAE